MSKNFVNYEKLSSDLNTLFSNPNEFADFEIEILDSTGKTTHNFSCNKSILSCRNDYFQALFRSKMKEFQESKVKFNDINGKSMEIILKYIYTGILEIDPENAIQTLIDSKKLLLEDPITIFLINFIKNHLDIWNVIDVLYLANELMIYDLADDCLNFIYENLILLNQSNEIVKLEEENFLKILKKDTFSISEMELFNMIIKWADYHLSIPNNIVDNKKNSEKISQKIGNLIHQISFCFMEESEIEQIQSMNVVPQMYIDDVIQFQRQNGDCPDLIKKYQEMGSKILEEPNQLRKSEILQGSNKYLKALSRWINSPSFLSKVRLGFSAKKNGFMPSDFHSHCDNKGATVVIILTKNGFIFGGFTKVGWTNDKNKWRSEDSSNASGWIPDPDAFVFSLKNHLNHDPVKFPLISSESLNAIYYSDMDGPSFGKSNGFDIGIRGNNFYDCWSYLGNTYSVLEKFGSNKYTNDSKNFFAGKYKWEIEEMEVFFV
ncbi:pep-cterm sorting domain-containing protein [Anaeramoeba ignava]|uniref:Pep-cterm sorting domain-containing protein n=1 Tax=Anaeramoeba ignava TaxID=1746090 RepID=A0A9Q0LF15_ANAIG|nr:pep-cterm sorting domain-containing protein [Anaeramoeba ignava]